jgi:hypothetical protein
MTDSQQYVRVELLSKRLYALDTGAVQDGNLTAIVLPEAQIIAVPTSRNYFADLKEQWKTRRTVLSGDPKSERLDRLLEFLQRPAEVSCTFSVEELGRLVGSFLDGDSQFATRARLVSLFGVLPEPGAARGKYARKVKAAFPHRVLSAVAYELLTGRSIDFRFLAAAFPAMRLGDIMENLLILSVGRERRLEGG